MTKANACKGKKKSSNRQGNVKKSAPVALILASLFSSVSNYDVIYFTRLLLCKIGYK